MTAIHKVRYSHQGVPYPRPFEKRFRDMRQGDCEVCGPTRDNEWFAHPDGWQCGSCWGRRFGLPTKDRGYRDASPELRKEIRRSFAARRAASPRHRLDHRIFSGMHRALRIPDVPRSGGSWEALVGYTADDLHAHLVARFTEGMTWERFRHDGIHIDHVKPLVLFTYQTPDDPEFRAAWALSNLQPLWGRDNRLKGPTYAQAA